MGVKRGRTYPPVVPKTDDRVAVLIVEDHLAIGRALAALIDSADDLSIAGVATNLLEAERSLRTSEPAVVLCDVMLGGDATGFDLLQRWAADARFLMYSAFDLPGYHARAVELGAAGYLSKMADLDTLLGAIRRVAAGTTWFEPTTLVSARRAPRPPTDREAAVLGLLVDGASNRAIAARLGVSVKTVEGVLRRLFDRYDVQNRTELVRLAQRQGWLPTPVGAADHSSVRS